MCIYIYIERERHSYCHFDRENDGKQLRQPHVETVKLKQSSLRSPILFAFSLCGPAVLCCEPLPSDPGSELRLDRPPKRDPKRAGHMHSSNPGQHGDGSSASTA